MKKNNKLMIKLSFLIFHVFMSDKKLPQLTAEILQQLKTALEEPDTKADEVLSIQATKFVELQGQMELAMEQGDIGAVYSLIPKLVQAQTMIRIQLLN